VSHRRGGDTIGVSPGSPLWSPWEILRWGVPAGSRPRKKPGGAAEPKPPASLPAAGPL